MVVEHHTAGRVYRHFDYIYTVPIYNQQWYGKEQQGNKRSFTKTY